MNFGFSYIGLIFLLMLFVPNLFWTKNKPENYEKYAENENKVLKAFEGAGQILVTCVVLIFNDFNIKTGSLRIIWLIAAFFFIVLYEVYWIRYFKSKKTMKDFYSSLLGIYGKNIILIVSVLILSIGHIGIHMNHKRESE